LWNVSSRQFLGELSTKDSEVDSVAFSPDGKMLATVSFALGSSVKMWNVDTRQLIEEPTLFGEAQSIPVAEPSAIPIPGPRVAGPSIDQLLTPDGNQALKKSGSEVASLQPIATSNLVSVDESSLSFSPDCKMLAWARGGEAGLFDLSNHTSKTPDLTSKALDLKGGLPAPTREMAFGSDSRTVASVGETGAVSLLNVVTGQRIGELLQEGSEFSVDMSVDHPENLVAFSHDGKTVASVSEDNYRVIRLWDVASHKLVEEVSDGTLVFRVAFSPDGRTLASVSDDNAVRLWDIADERMPRAAPGGSFPANHRRASYHLGNS
jgi:WD40 repeat protein